MTQSQYAADIAAIRQAQAEGAVTLQYIAERQTETLDMISDMNKCLKLHGKSLVALETWRTEHEHRHGREGDEVRGLKARINAIGAGNAALTAVGSFLAGLAGRQ